MMNFLRNLLLSIIFPAIPMKNRNKLIWKLSKTTPSRIWNGEFDKQISKLRKI